MAPLGPFGAAPRLAAGVSGGPHSLALALLAADWAEARGGDLLALVADHGLRPESAAEAAGVAAMLRARGIAAKVLALGLPAGPRLQERARAARRAALLGACAREGRPWLLLGHHRGDQAETLLFRAARGSFAAGLAGMAPLRAEAAALLLRPLLALPPARLEATVAASGLRPVRDPSNDDPRFARVRLRALLDDPSGQGPRVAALAATAAACGRWRAAEDSAVARRLAAAAELRPEGFAWIDPPALGADRLAAAALALLAGMVGGAARPPAATAAAALLAAGGGTLAGAWLTRRGRRLLLAREAALSAPPVPARAGAVWDGRFRLLGAGDDACVIGALGGEGRGLGAGLPSPVRRALPAIRRNGALEAVPALAYPTLSSCLPFTLVFAPAGGMPLPWAGCPGGGALGAAAGAGIGGAAWGRTVVPGEYE